MVGCRAGTLRGPDALHCDPDLVATPPAIGLGMTSSAPYSTVHPDAARDDDRVRQILDRILQHLGMDVVYLTQLKTGIQVYRSADARDDAFGVGVEPSCAVAPSVARLVTEGRLPNAMPDVAVDPRAVAYPEVLDRTVGAFIGVPVTAADGSIGGSLCCVSRVPRPELDEMCVSFVEVLVGFLPEPLARWEATHAARKQVKSLLSDGGIVAAMQPIVSLEDGRCVGVEALARFPEAGLSPDVVFGRARQVGLDERLERAAIQAAMSRRELIPKGAHLSFNVGPAGILSDGFCPMMEEYGSLDGLMLEITEHVSVEEYAALFDILEPLRAQGLRLAVDDVGAGYASLRHVLRMAPDVIKVDQSLVNGIARDPALRTIVTGIVLLALDMHAETIAEGVETAADAAALTDLGVDMVQGYLLAKPSIDPDDWRQWETPWLLPGSNGANLRTARARAASS